MSHFYDLSKVFRVAYRAGDISKDKAAEMFVDCLGALEWDLEEYMKEVPSDYGQYEKEELRIAREIIGE